MITYEELKALNDRIVEEALRDLGLHDRGKERLDRIAQACTVHIAKNEALKRHLKRDRDYQLRCQAIDARSLPLKEILKIAKGEA